MIASKSPHLGSISCEKIIFSPNQQIIWLPFRVVSLYFHGRCNPREKEESIIDKRNQARLVKKKKRSKNYYLKRTPSHWETRTSVWSPRSWERKKRHDNTQADLRKPSLLIIIYPIEQDIIKHPNNKQRRRASSRGRWRRMSVVSLLALASGALLLSPSSSPSSQTDGYRFARSSFLRCAQVSSSEKKTATVS